MKKTRTIKQEYLVCDITGEELQYPADGYVGAQRRHLCMKYRWLEEILDSLERNGLFKAANAAFDDAKEQYEQQKNTKTS